MSRARRPILAAIAALVAALLLGACVQLPDDGPVVEADIGSERDSDRASDIDAAPPETGASRLEIVDGFLEAMMAWPIKTSVAKEFLTDDAAAEWRPERTLIYSDLQTPVEDDSTVSVGLTNATYLDETGAWRGAAPPSWSTLEFRLTVEDGEFRILDPIDALIVRSSWFERRYRQLSLFYFDQTARILVPEPVFVPSGEQVATSLVSALLAGPPPRLRGVVRTFVPPLSVGLSVPVSSDGVATVDLLGGAPDALPDESELMLVQLAATLRQVPEVSSVRVTVGGEEIAAGPGGTAEYDVNRASAYDPTAGTPSGVLYGIRGGRLVTGGPGPLEVVAEPLGRVPPPLATVAVSTDAERVAAVTGDGRQVLMAPLRSPRNDGVRVILDDRTSVARPAWDASGRLWLLDRTPNGARVLLATDRRPPREITIRGITGSAARELLVSRDGTRLLFLLEADVGDRLVAARVVIDSGGRVQRVVGPTVIWSEPDYRVIDFVWTGPVQLGVVTPARPGELYEVETVSVDGASVGVDTLSSMVSGRIVGLAGDPSPDGAVYAVARDALVDVRTGERIAMSARVKDLDYPG